MQAKAKDNYRFGTVTAFGGQEYPKGEWRPVPAIYEAEARAQAALPHAILDVREDEPAAEPAAEPQPTPEAKPDQLVQPAAVVVEGRSAQAEAEKQLRKGGRK